MVDAKKFTVHVKFSFRKLFTRRMPKKLQQQVISYDETKRRGARGAEAQ